MRYKIGLLIVGVTLIVAGLLLGADLNPSYIKTRLESMDFRRVEPVEPVETATEIERLSPKDNQAEMQLEQVRLDATELIELIVPLGDVIVLPTSEPDILIEYFRSGGSVWTQELMVDQTKSMTTLQLITKNNLKLNQQDVTTRLHIPSSTKRLEVKVELGSLEFQDMKSIETTVQVDTGDLNIIRSQVLGSIDISLGDLKLEQAELTDTSILMEVGSIHGNGRFLGQCEMTVDVGDVTLILNQPESEISLDLEASLGDISGIRGGVFKEAEHHLKVRVDIGSINLKSKD